MSRVAVRSLPVWRTCFADEISKTALAFARQRATAHQPHFRLNLADHLPSQIGEETNITEKTELLGQGKKAEQADHAPMQQNRKTHMCICVTLTLRYVTACVVSRNTHKGKPGEEK